MRGEGYVLAKVFWWDWWWIKVVMRGEAVGGRERKATRGVAVLRKMRGRGGGEAREWIADGGKRWS